MLTQCDYIRGEIAWRCADAKPWSCPFPDIEAQRRAWTSFYELAPKGILRVEDHGKAKTFAEAYRYWREKDSRGAKLQRGYRWTPLYGWYHPGRTLEEQQRLDAGL